MGNEELTPHDLLLNEILRAQGVLAEQLSLGLDEANEGLRAHAAITRTALHEVAQRVCAGKLFIARSLCDDPPRAPPRSEDRRLQLSAATRAHSQNDRL
jgi:hypothetical protein